MHKPSVFSVFISVSLTFLYTVKVYYLEKKPMGLFSRWASFRDNFCKFKRGLLFEMGFFSR